MSKRYYHLWPEVTAFDNLLLAWRKAAKGKRDQATVAAFEYDLEANLLELQAELRDDRYRPGPYTSFFIREHKRRLISAAPFRDRNDRQRVASFAPLQINQGTTGVIASRARRFAASLCQARGNNSVMCGGAGGRAAGRLVEQQSEKRPCGES